MCKFSQLWKRRLRCQTRGFPLISVCEAAGLRQMKHILSGVPAFNNEPFHRRIKVLGRTRRLTEDGPQRVYLTGRPPVGATRRLHWLHMLPVSTSGAVTCKAAVGALIQSLTRNVGIGTRPIPVPDRYRGGWNWCWPSWENCQVLPLRV